MKCKFAGAEWGKRLLTGLLLLGLAGSAVPLAAQGLAERQQANWHHWRGPLATGASPTASPPLEWDAEKNVQWRVAIEGRGSSTPIIWEDLVFLLTAIDTGRVDPDLPAPADQPKRPFGITFPNVIYQYVVLALDRQTGKELWRQVAIEKVPHEGHHGDNSFASSSPTTDGERLYVWFGSAGLYCYDLAGNLQWKRDLGEVSTRLSFGEASSPVVHGNRLIITRDNEGQSYIVALDTATGETVWQTDRDERSSWMTPVVVESNGKTQVIASATKRVRSYDLKDGSLLWRCSGQVSNVSPSPVVLGDTVYCMSGYRGSAAQAIPLDSTGDITDKLVWSLDRGTPYVPSPLLHEGLLYFNQSNNAILSIVDAKTGEPALDRTRLPIQQNIYASPVAAGERVYFTGRGGTTVVLKAGSTGEVLATNELGEDVDASPALVGDQLFLRGKRHLYCISEKK